MKKELKNLQKKTVTTTVHIIKWIFLIITIYIIVITAWGFYQKGLSFLDDIVTLSVGGFFAFFMGYFGWRLAQMIEDWLSKR